jgi:hypothetical protein
MHQRSIQQRLSAEVALQLLSAHDQWPEHAVLHVSNGWAPIMFTTSKSPLGSLPTNPDRDSKPLKLQAAHAAAGRYWACISSVNDNACMCWGLLLA